MQIDPFVFPGCSNTSPLQLTAKRYGHQSSSNSGITFILAHCVGAHKEQWEPTIDALFKLSPVGTIREVWAFDWQSHGDGALVNKEALRRRPKGVSVLEWAEAIAAFVKSSHVQGHRIVAMGHSAGAGTMMLTTTYFETTRSPYEAMILLEPTIITREDYHENIEDRQMEMDFAVGSTAKRRSTWPTREEALEWLTPRYPFLIWDPRVVKIYTEHGIYIDSSVEPSVVRLKCDPIQESMSFPDTEPHFEAARQLGRVCQSLPVHLLWGETESLINEKIRNSLCDASQGRVIASVSYVPNAGHLVAQEAPDALAEAVHRIIALGEIKNGQLAKL